LPSLSTALRGGPLKNYEEGGGGDKNRAGETERKIVHLYVQKQILADFSKGKIIS
jgi:hypothetical protein